MQNRRLNGTFTCMYGSIIKTTTKSKPSTQTKKKAIFKKMQTKTQQSTQQHTAHTT